MRRRVTAVDQSGGATFTRRVIVTAANRVESVRASLHRPDVSHVIFDFDGTLSWLRHGWPDLMLKLFLERFPHGLSKPEGIAAILRADILALNGKPSIHQMLRFCEVVRALGAAPPDPEELLGEYQRRLAMTVRGRMDRLERGKACRADFIVAGAKEMIERLLERGLTLIILSGTAEAEVKQEAELLGLSPSFGRHIYGSTPGTDFSKKDVIDRILREERIAGSHLLAFGDGPVEIAFARAVGGLAIGVASDETANGTHRVDPDKRAQLIRAGADAIVPDYAEADALLAAIFGA